MIDMEISISKIKQLKAERAALIEVGQRLYARVRPESKYYGQGEKDALFPVYVLTREAAGYVVLGGPGGQYRLEDVDLFVVGDGDRALQIR
jgi:hypothetical protein